MTGLRIAYYLAVETDSLSMVLPALSDRRAAIEGNPSGRLGTGLPGKHRQIGHADSANPPCPATAAHACPINRTRSRINASG